MICGSVFDVLLTREVNLSLGVQVFGFFNNHFLNADMPEEMQQDLAECATQALEKYNTEKDTAAQIKESDKKYNPTR